MRPMFISLALASMLVVSLSQGLQIIQTNDDGWAEMYLRETARHLKSIGHEVLVSAPAQDMSGTSSRQRSPIPRDKPCHYDSCPATNRTWGRDSTEDDVYWVNGYPATAIRYGIEKFALKKWPDKTLSRFRDIILSGPNVGHNLYSNVSLSGTVGAATWANSIHRFAAIAVSGAGDVRGPHTTRPVPAQAEVYAQIIAKLIGSLWEMRIGYTRILPAGTWLNVNLPALDGERCKTVDDFKFIFTKLGSGLASDRGPYHCHRHILPMEYDVLRRDDGCYVTVSLGDSRSKGSAPMNRQVQFRRVIQRFFACLPIHDLMDHGREDIHPLADGGERWQ